MPSSPSSRPDGGWLCAKPYAHRGRHGPGRVENSGVAFKAAIALGFGIELDVQLSADGAAMVFHDDQLDRLTRETGPVAGRSAAQLQRVPLRGMSETIPTLPEALALIDGRVPLLIELKAPRRDVAALCQSVGSALRGYSGQAAVMSFNPEVGRWFWVHAPGVIRGLVVTEKGKRGWRGRLERRLGIWRARPDFLAYDIRDLPSAFAARERARGTPVLTWTVRSTRDREVAAAHADQIIHELPES